MLYILEEEKKTFRWWLGGKVRQTFVDFFKVARIEQSQKRAACAVVLFGAVWCQENGYWN